MTIKNEKTAIKVGILFFIGLISGKILRYASIIVVTQFGAQGYGIYAMVISTAWFFVPICIMGMGEGLQRYIPKYLVEKKLEKTKGTFIYAIITTLTASFLCMILVAITAPHLSNAIVGDGSLSPYLIIGTLIIPLEATIRLVSIGFMARSKVIPVTFIRQVALNMIRLALFIIVLYLGLGIASMIYVEAIATFTALMILLAWLLKDWSLLTDKSIKAENTMKTLLQFSLLLVPYMLLPHTVEVINNTLLSIHESVSSVGVFNTGYPIAVLAPLISASLMFGMFPTLSTMIARKKDTKRFIDNMTISQLIIMIPITLSLITYPDYIIRILFPQEFIGASQILPILAIAYVIWGYSNLRATVLKAHGRSKSLFLISIPIAAFHLINASILAPNHGMWGISIATLVTMMLLAITMEVLNKRINAPIINKQALIMIALSYLTYLVFHSLKVLTTGILIPAQMILLCMVFASMSYLIILDDDQRYELKSLMKNKLKQVSQQ